MARWDIAEWVGPTPNKVVGGMSEYRGLVLHIMQGTYVGSIAWGKNPTSNISFHFATRADGHIGQLVDTADAAWTQAAGNGHWLSVENEGYSGNPLTAGQVEAVAQIYARGVRDYGWAYDLAESPADGGLGWHGMGGAAWGGHFDCPGEPVKAQRPAILARAQEINGGEATDMTPQQGELLNALAWRMDAVFADLSATREPGQPAEPNNLHSRLMEIEGKIPVAGGGPGGGLTEEQVRAIVRSELDATRLTH